jgi:hypothetical protein
MSNKPRTQEEHNAELEAFQRRLDHDDRLFTNIAESDATDSGHTDVANTVTRRAPQRPTLDESDGDTDE